MAGREGESAGGGGGGGREGRRERGGGRAREINGQYES